MKNNEIKALIEKYKLIIKDGKVGTYARVNKDEFLRDVPPHKDEIIAYFEAEQQARRDKRAREEAAFNEIPGVLEIAEARRQEAAWRAAFNRMMEAGSSKMPAIEHKTPAEMAALEAKYPMAVFALEAQYRAAATENDRLYTIWNTTYQAIKDGKDISEIKADHDRRMSEYTGRAIYN